MDRRAAFFFCVAVVCLVLVPVTEGEHRWVPVTLTIVYTLLAFASWADRRSRAGATTHADDVAARLRQLDRP